MRVLAGLIAIAAGASAGLTGRDILETSGAVLVAIIVAVGGWLTARHAKAGSSASDGMDILHELVDDLRTAQERDRMLIAKLRERIEALEARAAVADMAIVYIGELSEAWPADVPQPPPPGGLWAHLPERVQRTLWRR